ncbi:hypothetical protein QR680_001737 [Steinernema hermaphroditum]|uniref:Uncharacterized protein n=1 Tax=Steinernema hermaphroditum TaxID=289476 RepID=A0AA39H1P8_9BILA|nr:hypothetical protein QR680_001737 [Steinernema hermaphroditum]
MRAIPLSSAVLLTLCALAHHCWTTHASSLAEYHGGNEKYELPEYTVHNVSRRAPIEEHVRVRRALYKNAGAAMTCDIGWTGLYCENPICYDHAESLAPPSDTDYIEMLYLASGCDGEINFPVEEGVGSLQVAVSTDIGKPVVNLTSRLGNVLAPDTSISVDRQGVFIYKELTAGPYRVNVDIGKLETTLCHVEISVESKFGVSLRAGLINSPHSDRVVDTNGVGGVAEYIAVHAFNLSSPGAPAVVRTRDYRKRFSSYTQLLTRRYECGYEYYAGMFAFETDKEFILSVDGVDGYGYNFRRSKRLSCTKPSTIPTNPPTTPAPTMECYNNGTLMNSGKENAVCFCPELFTGRQCDQSICMNGGTLHGQLECECPSGFSGPNCQNVVCPSKSYNFDTDYRTLIVVLRKTQSMAPYIQNITDSLQRVNDHMVQGIYGESLYRGFRLITYANDQVDSNPYSSLADLLTAIKSTTLVPSKNCSDSISNAIAKAFEAPFVFNKSPINVFTDVVADDNDDYFDVISRNTFKKFQMYFFVPQGGSCNADPMSPGARIMDKIAHHTGGLVLTPSQDNFVLLTSSVITTISTHAAPLLVNDYAHCRTNSYNTFLVDSSMKHVLILASGKNLSISFNDPTGTAVQVTPFVADGNNYVWEIEQAVVGEYLMTLKSDQDNAPCSFRVIGQSKYELFFGMSTGLLDDYAMTDPVYQLPNHIVAHFNGFDEDKIDPFKLFAEIAITTTDEEGNSVPLYYSSGVYRDGCMYKLYFGPYTCTAPDQLLYITVYADDPTGATIQRTAVGVCAFKPLTPAPPTGCQNGGVTNPLKNDTCICTPNYGGLHCENIKCLNNGTAVHGRCECPRGVEGKFCELLTCNQIAEGVNFDSNHRSLAFVLSTRTSMKDSLNAIANKVDNLLRELQSASTNFITQFTIITVNQTVVTELRTTADPNGFADGVKYVVSDIIPQQATPETILDIIPALHNSGLAGVYAAEDCTDGYEFYIPVDGWTQSLMITAHGDDPQITVTLPNGLDSIHQTIKYENAIAFDNKSIVTEYIIPCDDGWGESKGRYCFKYDPYNAVSWKSASDSCHQLGGSLVNIFSQEDEKQIEVGIYKTESWIGLNRINGVWTWDVPAGVAQTDLTGNSYTNWAANEPSDNNSGKDCVTIKRDTNNVPKWFTTECSKQVYSVCQKHKYGQAMMPSDPIKNRLPAGVWTVRLQSSGNCSLQARVQSYIQVYYGFTTEGVHSDKAERYANIDSKSNRYIATTTGLTAGNPDFNPNGVGGRLNYGFMYKSGVMISPVTFQARASCAYKSVSQDFACPDYYTKNKFMEKYAVKFSGIDQFGNLFERWSSAVCVIKHATCQNGGVANDGKCVCQPGFTGPDCDYHICLNGGEQNQGKCQCPAEYTGESCEFPLCDQMSAPNFNNDNRTLAIVLETTFKNTPAMIRLRKKLKGIIDSVESGPTSSWFNNYILYPFDSLSDKPNWFKPTVSSNSDDLLKALEDIPLNECPEDQICETGDKCPRPIMTALNETLNHPKFVSPNSVVFVITRSSAEDAVLYYDIEPNIQKSKAQINIILPDVASPCNQGFDTMTSGEMVDIFLPSYLPSLYKSSTLNSGYMDQGCDSLEFFFQIDSGTTEFTVDFYGQQPSVTLYAPNGQQLPSNPSLITSGGNYLGVYQLDTQLNMTAGIYRINMQSSGDRCALNIRSRSNIEIYAGFTQVDDAVNGATQDNAHFAPLQGISRKNIMLFHADGFGEPGSVLYYAQIISFRRGLEFTTPLVKRQGCTYQYVSTKSFDCPQSTFFIMVFGIDSKGHHFERLFLTHCSDTRVPALPAAPTCNLAETQTDFVFVVDSSSALDTKSFQQIQTLITNTMTPYQISSGNTQIAALTVSNVSHPSFTYADAASGDLNSLINNKVVYDGSSGQALDDALNYIKSSIAAGNRQGVRHQIVYITGNSKFTNGDPVETVRMIKRAGVAGIITIGYDIPAFDTFLELVAGPRCTLTVSSATDLATYGQNFIQSNSCRQRPICGEA